MGFPAAFLVVVLDNVPETVSEIKLNRGKCAVVVYEVSLFVSVRCVCCYLAISFWDVAFSPLIQRYSRLEDFFCSGRHRKVRFNVTIQWIVA